MRIKREKDKNEYINASNVWVRNFSKSGVKPISLNQLIDPQDYKLVLSNEVSNRSKNLSKIDEENFFFPKIVIVSDGYQFSTRQKILKDLPPDVAIFAVNHALAKWELIPSRAINFYIVNNPYPECKFNLQQKHQYYPSCVASSRTNSEFIKKYKGNLFLYEPSQQIGFGQLANNKYCIDDYRNPICASIGLAYQFGVQKLMLFCCDDSFEESRQGAVQLQNRLWTYPQHIISHNIIDANLYWLSHQEDKEDKEVKISNYSSGPEYFNSTYINEEHEVIDFFTEVK